MDTPASNTSPIFFPNFSFVQQQEPLPTHAHQWFINVFILMECTLFIWLITVIFCFYFIPQRMFVLQCKSDLLVDFLSHLGHSELKPIIYSCSTSLFHNSFCLVDSHFNFPFPYECHIFRTDISIFNKLWSSHCPEVTE